MYSVELALLLYLPEYSKHFHCGSAYHDIAKDNILAKIPTVGDVTARGKDKRRLDSVSTDYSVGGAAI